MEKNNVVLIISDQWSKRTADGSGNNPNGVLTPGIDRLAREGIRFDNNYSAFPLCCPARAAMFTGVMPHENHIIDNDEIIQAKTGTIPKRIDLVTMGRAFKEAGYETAYFGKEHAGGYDNDGIDIFGQLRYHGGGALAEGAVYDQIFPRDALDYLEMKNKAGNQAGGEEASFFMVLSLINPHDICKVLGGKAKDATMADGILFCQDDSHPYLRGQARPKLPPNFDNTADKGIMGDEEWMFEGLDSMSENEWRRRIGVYNLLVEKTDMYIQEVLEALDRKNLTEDTLVVFTTDHGDMMGSHRRIAKTNFYEESAGTNLILRWPGKIAPGQVNVSAYTNTIDLMPSLLELCNINIPTTVKGKSFAAECKGKDSGQFKETYAENEYSRMVCFEGYKYVISKVDGEIHHILYDRNKDEGETKNVYMQTGYEEASKLANQKITDWIEKEKIGICF